MSACTTKPQVYYCLLLPLFQQLWASLITPWPPNRILHLLDLSEKVLSLAFRYFLHIELGSFECKSHQLNLFKKQPHFTWPGHCFRLDLQCLFVNWYPNDPWKWVKKNSSWWLHFRSYHPLRGHHSTIHQNTKNPRQKKRRLISIAWLLS